MKSKLLHYRLGLPKGGRSGAASVPAKNDEHLSKLFESVNRSLELANSGESLREYVSEIEGLARGIFTSEGISPDPIVARCAQIVSEYENPRSDDEWASAPEQVPEGTPQPLPRSAITEFMYGAARVLLRVNVLKVTMSQSIINPWILAADCMRLEEAHRQLVCAGAYAEGRRRTPKEVKEEQARERQNRMREWIEANGGKFPVNDKVTQIALGYLNAGTASARKLFSRDLTAVHASHRARK